jgi:hypothetical protein
MPTREKTMVKQNLNWEARARKTGDAIKRLLDKEFPHVSRDRFEPSMLNERSLKGANLVYAIVAYSKWLTRVALRIAIEEGDERQTVTIIEEVRRLRTRQLVLAST